MPTITPNQIFQVKQYSISIISSIIFILIGYAIFFVFFGEIKSQKTQDGAKIYLPVSKIYLYVSIISFGISAMTIILSIYFYKKIFPIQKSRTLYWLYFAFSVAFAGIILNIFYILQKFPQCLENQVFKEDIQQCVPKCVSGSRLYNNIKCKPIPITEPFIFGDDDTCSPDNLDACKSFTYKTNEIPKMLGGKSVCDTEFVVQCKDNGNGTTTVYFNSSATCTEGDTTYYPSEVPGFQSAYSTNDDKNCIDTFLDSTTTDSKTITDCFGTEASYICGLDKGTAVTLKQVQYPGCKDVNVCTKDITQYSQKINAKSTDEGITCNVVNIINETPDNNVSVSNKIEKSCKENEIFNRNTLSCESVNVGDGDDNDCEDNSPQQYTTDCSKFSQCFKEKNSCPFRGGNVDCIYKCDGTYKYTICNSTDPCFRNNNIKKKGYIIPSNTPCKNTYCMVDRKSYSCQSADTCFGDCTPYTQNKYKDCSDGSSCDASTGDIVTDSSKTITGECSHGGENAVTGNGHCVKAGLGISSLHHWELNNPYAGITATITTNNDGKRCGGGYDSSDHRNPQSNLRDITVNQNVCPVGTKPFFYASKFDKSPTKDCNGKHQAFYSRIDYRCCDALKFNYEKQTPTSIPAENDNVCLSETKSIKAKSNGATSILVGRDGGKENPTNDHDACDVNPNNGYNKLKKLLTDVNNSIWLTNNTECS